MIAERRRTIAVTPPVYEFSIEQRAALQLLARALEYLGGNREQADIHAGQILWQCRQLVLLAAERHPCQGGAQ